MNQPIEKKYHDFLNSVANGLDSIFNGPDCPADKKVTGFFLFAYDFKKGPEQGRMNYISNSHRDDVLTGLKEMVAHLEGRLHNHETKQ